MRFTQGIQKYRDASRAKSKEKREEKDRRKSDRNAEPIANKISAKNAVKNFEKNPEKSAEKANEKLNPKIEAKSEIKGAALKPPQVSAVASAQIVPAPVAEALQEAQEAASKVNEEQALQAEIAQEIEQEAAQTSQLVKADYSPTNTGRDQLIVEYAPLIKYIAQKIAARLPANIELDDLISSGVIGLMDAIDKYDSSRDNKFKTYAEFRIRGAILDELRAQDWVPRSVREKAKQLERAYSKIEQEKGRQATDDEICTNLGINQQEFNDMLTQVRCVSLLSVDDISNLSKADKRSIHGIGENDLRTPTPFNEVSLAHLKKMIADSIRDLPEKQRLVLSLYYYEDLNLKEIGRVLDVTESRVSQLHTQAVLKLKARLRNHWDDFAALMA